MDATTILILLAWVVGPFLMVFGVIRLHRMLQRARSKKPDREKRD
jgi:hypothetical protein